MAHAHVLRINKGLVILLAVKVVEGKFKTNSPVLQSNNLFISLCTKTYTQCKFFLNINNFSKDESCNLLEYIFLRQKVSFFASNIK